MALTIENDVALGTLNTFALPCTAAHFARLQKDNDLPALLDEADRQHWPVTVLGGGSNVVLPQVLPGLTVLMCQRGIQYEELGDRVRVTAAAGESWHALVMDSVARGLGGLENLALIPGTVGAAPVQNIGAYGVELCQCLESVRGWHREEKQWQTLRAEDCAFAYRDSVFKQRLHNRFIITSVTLRLSRYARPDTSYQALAEELQRRSCADPAPRDVAEAVMAIRRRKLPDPAQLPNVGSFFKNPIISAERHAQLRTRYPQLVSYPLADGRFKLAAGWLIDSAGWRGRRLGAVGMHEHQALVMVNYGGASAADVAQLAQRIEADIDERFGVQLESEPVRP